MKPEQIETLVRTHELPGEELYALLTEEPDDDSALYAAADAVRRENYGDAVYLRGLIEFTNYCKNDCYYCGIRHGNTRAERYRLTKEQILACTDEGYALGYRTFVLQGGEDPYFTDERLCEIISAIHAQHKDCRITLSVGERSRESYQAFFDAGARRYLLRHETADADHYGKLHPASMSLHERQRCLFHLKDIGYQVGTGFMIGSPYQTPSTLCEDLFFMQALQPDMIGVGPYITHPDTPFAGQPSGDLKRGLRILAILRLMFPKALIPATTAFGTIHPQGRELALKAGCNVVMPNLSPVGVRELYSLYENKICTGEESAQCRKCLEQRVEAAGYRIVTDVGDARTLQPPKENPLLAYYYYPFVPNTDVRPYTREQLMDPKTVETLFDYCQILEAYITRAGWAFLISHYGYEKLYEIDKKSGWYDVDTLEEYIGWVHYNITTWGENE